MFVSALCFAGGFFIAAWGVHEHSIMLLYLGYGVIGGCGLVAFPAEYGISGVMTFIVNHDGVVYEKDLGPSTTAREQQMKLFNPDTGWRKVTPN